MIHLPPETLWLGHVGDVRKIRDVMDAGIRALVDLAVNEPMPALPRELIYCRIPLVDGSDNPPEVIGLAIRTVATLLRGRIPTLVYCSAGMSRTPAVASAAVASLRGQTAAECLSEWGEKIPHDVSPGLWADVQAVAQRETLE